jgi:hypothetical protein
LKFKYKERKKHELIILYPRMQMEKHDNQIKIILDDPGEFGVYTPALHRRGKDVLQTEGK